MTSAWEILVVEEGTAAADLVRSVLERAGIESIEADGPTALAMAEGRKPDLAIVGANVRAPSSTELGTALRAMSIPVMYMTDTADVITLERLGSTLPEGLLVRPFTEAQLLASVHLALHRASAVGEHACRAAVERISQVLVELGIVDPRSANGQTARDLPGLRELSSREWEVLRALLDHERVPAIARRLHISPATVRNHLKAIYTKVGVHSQQELLHKILRV